jgi:probable rRNA maturation factor
VDPDSSRARVTVTDGRGRAIRDGGLRRWLTAVAPAQARGAVAVALVTDPHIRRLNRDYRGKDGLTDVLSFPTHDFRLTSLRQGYAGPPQRSARRRKAGHVASGFSRNDAWNAELPLGDIVIATGVAKRQARAAGHTCATELRVLALHGLLHLLGYDHERDGGAMRRVEQRLRRKGGLREGLIDRAGRPFRGRRS